jgi:hypothetical protein
MYQKLKQTHIDLFLEDCSKVRVCTEAIVAAYAGATATKELLLKEGNPLTKGLSSFSIEFSICQEDAIASTNLLGLSTTFETMEAFHPARVTDILLKEQSENKDNPYWPFFDED